MRGLLLWTISDFPAYGLISGLCTKGYLACPVCGPRTISRATRGPKKHKQVFVGARRWTRRTHPYRVNLRFNGAEEHESAPPRQSATDILHGASLRERFLQGLQTGRPGRPDSRRDLYRRHGVRRRSVLYNLPYWEVMSTFSIYYVFSYAGRWYMLHFF
jgi:hypothetical protein